MVELTIVMNCGTGTYETKTYLIEDYIKE